MPPENERIFLYIRITHGDELTQSAKFVFLTFIGDRVTPMKKARCQNDKIAVKDALPVSLIGDKNIKLQILNDPIKT